MIKNILSIAFAFTTFIGGYWLGSMDASIEITKAVSNNNAESYALAAGLYHASLKATDDEYYSRGYKSIIEEQLWGEIDLYVSIYKQGLIKDRIDTPIVTSLLNWVYPFDPSTLYMPSKMVQHYFQEFPPTEKSKKELLKSYIKYTNNDQI